MLTKKQKCKLDDMTANYIIGMKKHTKADDNTITAWAKRYYIIMTQELQKQCKR